MTPNPSHELTESLVAALNWLNEQNYRLRAVAKAAGPTPDKHGLANSWHYKRNSQSALSQGRANTGFEGCTLCQIDDALDALAPGDLDD